MAEIPVLTFDCGGWCPALGKSYRPGRHRPATAEEYNALAPYAVGAKPLEGAAAPDAAAHDDAPGFRPDRASRGELLDFIKANGGSANPNQSTKDLRAAAAGILAGA